MTALEWGRDYLRRGWALVVIYPVRGGACACQTDPKCRRKCNNASDRGKHPIRGLKHGAIYNPAKLQAELEKWPDAGLGILTGKRSGLVAIDVDWRNVTDRAAVERYLTELGATRTHTTGDGEHYLVRYRDGLGKFDLLPGLQVIGDGGMVVAPPSVHFKTGKAYTVANEAELAPWPDAWPIPEREPSPSSSAKPTRPSYLPPGLLDAITARAATEKGNEITFKCPWPDNHKRGDLNPSATFNTRKGCGRCRSCGEKYGWLRLSERLGVPVHRRMKPEAVTAAAAELERQAMSEKWIPNLRAVWFAVLAICAEKGNPCVALSARDVGDRAGFGRKTASKWLRALVDFGELELIHKGTRWSATANVYLVPGLSQKTPTVSTTPPKGATVGHKWDTLNADLYRHFGGLGKRGAELVAALDAGERFAGPRDIERRLHIPRATAARKQRQCLELGLAILNEDGELVRGPVTIAEASERVAAAGAGERQRERHAKDRAAYARYLASYEKNYPDKLTPSPLEAAAAPVRTEGEAGQCEQSWLDSIPDDEAAVVSREFARVLRSSTDYCCLARPVFGLSATTRKPPLSIERGFFAELSRQRSQPIGAPMTC